MVLNIIHGQILVVIGRVATQPEQPQSLYQIRINGCWKVGQCLVLACQANPRIAEIAFTPTPRLEEYRVIEATYLCSHCRFGFDWFEEVHDHQQISTLDHRAAAGTR